MSERKVSTSPSRATLIVYFGAIFMVLTLILLVTMRMDFGSTGFNIIRIGLIILLNILFFLTASQLIRLFSTVEKSVRFPGTCGVKFSIGFGSSFYVCPPVAWRWLHLWRPKLDALLLEPDQRIWISRSIAL